MALARCKECRGAVSRKADYCPHCGATLRRRHFGALALASLAFGAGYLSAGYGERFLWSEPEQMSARAGTAPEATTPERDPRFITSFRQSAERNPGRDRDTRSVASYHRDKQAIFREIQALARVGKYQEALAKAEPYLGINDPELHALRDQVRERQVVALLRRIPSNEFQRNRDLYAELVRLNPEEATYRDKLAHYEQRLAAARVREKEIVALLQTIPTEEYRKNRDLYAELVRLNPEEAAYHSKLYFYQQKLDAQADQ